MIKSLLNALKKLFTPTTTYDNLEAYIVAGNPQNSGDVDRLERDFYQKKQVGFFETYY